MAGRVFLDINQLGVLQPIMTHRFETWCKAKGFDAVEPDNMDTWEEANNGFPPGTLTVSASNTYDEWVANEVHSLGMAVFQKNDSEEVGTLKSYFDGAVSEQCNQYSECSNFSPYIAENKPVINAEYKGTTGTFCPKDEALGIVGAKFKLELGATGFEPCPND